MMDDRFKYVNKARAYVNANIKLLPQRNHWAEVAGVLNAWLVAKDSIIAELKAKKPRNARNRK